MTTRTDEATCDYCRRTVYRFDKAPPGFDDVNGTGWAYDDSGDCLEDFICPARESSARWPDGKPHEVTA